MNMAYWKQRLIYEFLRFMDTTFPGWSAPRPERYDYLSPESHHFWMGRVYKGGER